MTATSDLQTTDGREVTTTVTEATADRWVITQKNKKAGGPDVRVTRVFKEGGIEMTFETGGVVSNHFYTRL